MIEMTSSIISKKIIANSLKYLMETESFHKISVSDIMLHCQMRRQTFYYHFKDKFELLSWIYREETKENIIDFLDYETWENILIYYLITFMKIKNFTEMLLKSLNKTRLITIYLSIQKLIHENYWWTICELRIQSFWWDKNTIASFYSHGFVGTIKDWIESKCEVYPSIMSSLMKNMINNQLLLLLEQSAK